MAEAALHASELVLAGQRPLIPLPVLDEVLLNTHWTTSRNDSPKLNTALYSMRCTLSAMCVMHLHTTPDKKTSACEQTCENTYTELLSSLRIKLDQTSKRNDKPIYRMGFNEQDNENDRSENSQDGTASENLFGE